MASWQGKNRTQEQLLAMTRDGRLFSTFIHRESSVCEMLILEDIFQHENSRHHLQYLTMESWEYQQSPTYIHAWKFSYRKPTKQTAY